ncbi:MAG: hypothetical protein AAB499_02240 [Patescibacteria group bacterium]
MVGRLGPPMIFLLLIVSLGFGWAVFNPSNQSRSDETVLKNLSQFALNSKIPEGGKVKSSSGEELDLKSVINSIKGPILLTFWSPDCAHCQEGVKNLDQFPSEKWTNLLIAHRVRSFAVGQLLTTYGVGLSSFVDEQGLLLLDWRSTMPGSFLIQEGDIRYFFPGRMDRKILELLQSELAGQ